MALGHPHGFVSRNTFVLSSPTTIHMYTSTSTKKKQYSCNSGNLAPAAEVRPRCVSHVMHLVEVCRTTESRTAHRRFKSAAKTEFEFSLTLSHSVVVSSRLRPPGVPLPGSRSVPSALRWTTRRRRFLRAKQHGQTNQRRATTTKLSGADWGQIVVAPPFEITKTQVGYSLHKTPASSSS